MKEGKLSSALMERYGIEEKDSVGEVLWHSLNESGEIDIYDMRFGDTVIRNLKESDLVEGHAEEHMRDNEHGLQEANDSKRRKRTKK
tara:strand:- start:296 stop:556 length:261 start_codon:yes stop_codon:yes gene_type:complete